VMSIFFLLCCCFAQLDERWFCPEEQKNEK